MPPVLTDEQWSLIQPLLPPPSPAARGRPPLDNRRILEGILWKIRSGTPWYDLPPSYPSYQSCYRHYRIWRRDGVMAEIYLTLYQDLYARGGFDFFQAIQGKRIHLSRGGSGFSIEVDPDLIGTWQLSTTLILLAAYHKKLRSAKSKARS